MSEQSHLSILVVEDDPHTRAATLRLLSSVGGYDVHAVPNAEEALAALARYPFDAVISDHHLGGMDGVQLLELCKRSFPTVSRVLTTSSNDFEVATRAVNEAAVLAIVRKPYRNPQLWRTIGALRAMQRRNTLPQAFVPEPSDAPTIAAYELSDVDADAIRRVAEVVS